MPGNFGPSSKTGLHPAEMTIAEVVKQKQLLREMEEDTRRGEARKVKLEKKKRRRRKIRRISFESIQCLMTEPSRKKR